METFILKELAEGGKALAEAYLRGDNPCLGVPRENIIFCNKDFAFIDMQFSLVISKITSSDKK